MRYPVAVYNVGPFGENGRGGGDLARELVGFVRSGRKVIALVETIGWGDLPTLKEFWCVRDASTEGRANLSVYVAKTLAFDPDTDARWHPRTVTWLRTEGPHGGTPQAGAHPAREDLELTIGGGQWGVWHQPPRGIRDPKPPHEWITDRAQQEGVDLWSRRMAPWLRDDWSARTPESQKAARGRLRVLLGDPNRDPDAPANVPGPHMLADRIDGWRAGTSIEGGVVRGGGFVAARKQPSVGGVHLGSDHHGAFLATVVPR